MSVFCEAGVEGKTATLEATGSIPAEPATVEAVVSAKPHADVAALAAAALKAKAVADAAEQALIDAASQGNA